MLLELILLLLVIIHKAKYRMSLPWDRPVDQTAQSNQRLVCLDLSRPRQYKVKSRMKRCKIDKRSLFFSSVSVYPVNKNTNMRDFRYNKKHRKRFDNLREYSLLVNRYNSRVRDGI